MSSLDMRSPLAKERDKWLADHCIEIDRWAAEAGVPSQYIKNRLEMAFVDGALAEHRLKLIKEGQR